VEVLGLVVRRQAASWTQWGPWLALVGVVMPLGVLLGQLSWSWADGSAIYAFLYVNNWTWAYLESPGARRDLFDISTRVCLNDFALVHGISETVRATGANVDWRGDGRARVEGCEPLS